MIRVLLADDHAVVRDGLRMLLESTGAIQVVGDASNGFEAVRAAREMRPDVVVMDISMPELNGIEATRQIREQCPHTRVLMLSMYDSRENVQRATKAGAMGYVLKDSAAREVVTAIREIHAGRPFYSKTIAEMIFQDFAHKPEQDGTSGDPLERLSPREREILQLVVEGKSSAEIADRIYLSPKTVETYRSRLMQKLGIHDIPGLVKFAIRHGLTPL